MKILLSLKPLIENPFDIYNYDKVIMNPMYCGGQIFQPKKCDMYVYLLQIFPEDINRLNKKYLKSFKYFIKICDNIDYQFIKQNHCTLLLLTYFFIAKYINYESIIKKIVISIIKKHKYFEIYYMSFYNYLHYFNPVHIINTKMGIKLYKYILSLNIYYTKYNTYYFTPTNFINIYKKNKNINNLIKINTQHKIWQHKRLFILLCIL